ncbi:hypothetical protein [Bulleidia sp. HCP3S3_F2]|uniref:hypothetical protein n=1 Tax=unclassified Bulleidia TaxID=2704656 RepID=UPI003F88EC6A
MYLIWRSTVCSVNEEYVKQMPKKPDNNRIGLYEEVVDYCERVYRLVDDDESLKAYKNIQENMNLLRETLDDVNEELTYSKDSDAKTGHKTADTEFFGYKTHIAMTPERIITAAAVTSGEKHDGRDLHL